MNISTENLIAAYPFTNDDGKTLSRDYRVLTEENISMLISKLTNNSSYIISDNYSDSSLEFILGGRYFSIKKAGIDEIIKKIESDTPNTDSIYASLSITYNNTGYGVMDGYNPANDNEEPKDSDTSGEAEDSNTSEESKAKATSGESSGRVFSGVSFQSSPSKGSPSLLILKKIAGNWTIPIESKFRFNQNVVKNICGGTV